MYVWMSQKEGRNENLLDKWQVIDVKTTNYYENGNNLHVWMLYTPNK